MRATGGQSAGAIYANNRNHNEADGNKRRAFINHTVAGGRATNGPYIGQNKRRFNMDSKA